MDMWCSRLPGGRSWLSLLFEVSRLLSTVCIENILERWTSSNWLARKEYFKEGKLARKGYHVCAGLGTDSTEGRSESMYFNISF
jgi:hypothetical protein